MGGRVEITEPVRAADGAHRPPGDKASSYLPDDEIDLGRLVLTLWRGKWLIGAMTALGVAAGAFFIANTSPVFQADALLQLEENSTALSLPSSLSTLVENEPRSVTEIELLRSRHVLGQAVADQNLDWRIAPDLMPVIGTMLSRYRFAFLDRVIPERFARPGDRIVLHDLVVPPGWLNRPIELTVQSEGRFRATLPDGTTLEGAQGIQVLQAEAGFSMTLAAISAPPGRRFFIQQIDEARAIQSLRARLFVSERGRASGILEMRITGEDKADNARTLNAILQAYQRQNIARSSAQADSSLTFIREQLPKAEQTLREAETLLNAYRAEQGTIDLSLETQTVLSQITRTEEGLAVLQGREDELRQRYTPAHPTYRQFLDERDRLQARLAILREQVGVLPETQRQMVNLTRGVDLAQRIYTELLTRAQQVEVLRASTIGNVRIVDVAVASPLAISPQKTRILVLSLLMGAIMGAGLVFMRNWLRKGIQEGSELERLGLPVFATINYSKLADTQGKRRGKLPILALEQSRDVTAEAFRSLRTSLHFGMLDARTPTLTVTSAHPEAGKSFLASNLAVVAAQAGQRVCIIDADLRRGQLRRYFDVPRNHPGLAEVLSGDLTLDDAVVLGPVTNLFFLSTGRYPPNPSELLMRAEFSQLIEQCARRYDLTIFDSPPALAVTDPVIISRSTGGTILVARHDMTQKGEVEAAINTFAAAGLRISGAVLNGFDPRKAKTGYGYGYGYRYDYKQRQD